MVTFDPLTFQIPSTHIYTISEVRGDDDGINYDPHTEKQLSSRLLMTDTADRND